jgi:secreted trypsin-like serine protease
LKKPVAIGFVFATALAGCSGGTATLPNASTGSQASQSTTRAAASIPAPYRCFPSGLPTKRAGVSPELAYISQCGVADAKEAANLQKFAIAMMAHLTTGDYGEYCTGTPVSYDPTTRVGFVVTAAHCVAGGEKAKGAKFTPSNIVTFSRPTYWVYQSTPGRLNDSSDLTGEINAVYVPSQYCEGAAFNERGVCGNLAVQNGDVAILKIEALDGHAMQVSPDLEIGDTSLKMTSSSDVMALGYGLNTTKTPEDRTLYYVDYEYFANDAYRTVKSDSSIMNGYLQNGNYYSIVCQGDSGGGDFYWDGSRWNLVGAHSWGPVPCGVWGKTYRSAHDISSDVRPWAHFIHEIIDKDTSPTGCGAISSSFVCKAR